jgi:transcription antitermination factor NusG
MSDEGDTGGIRRGNCIRITAGTFEGFEAIVTAVDQDA